MKARLFLSIAMLIGVVAINPPRAMASLEVSASVSINARADFYDPLAASGTWVEVGSYGRCWHPAGVAVEWRPYCYGYWEWTDCGWYWESDEPWAWACYHYGTWVYDSSYGWVWVPDIEWAPAWVYWRYGGGYVGWAPCPPRHGFVSVSVKPSAFVFVEAGHISDPVRPGAVIINNTTIINKTVEITKVRRENRTFEGSGKQKVVINEGPGVAVFEKASGKKFTAVSVREADRRTVLPEKFRQAKGDKSNPRVAPDQPRQVPDQPRSAPEHKVTPVNPPEAPGNGGHPNREPQPPAGRDVVPAPGHPPVPVGPPPGAGQEDNKGHGQEQGQGHEGHGRDKDNDHGGDRGGDHGNGNGNGDGGGGGHGHDR